MNLLKLTLSGFLQSYSSRSKWDYRGTDLYPTKSAIIGIIACAMGILRNDTYLDYLSQNLKVHVRVDKLGNLLTDLQTVNQPMLKADGKAKTGFHALLKKVYLTDSVFTVYVEGDYELLNKCYMALQDPKFPIYLGRKSCVPNLPICSEEPYQDISNLEDFIINDPLYHKLFGNKEDVITFEYYLEDESGEIINYDNLSSQGQRFYAPTAKSKHSFTKSVKMEENKVVFE